MENSGSKFSLTLTIIVLLIVLVGGYYVMMGNTAGETPVGEAPSPVSEEQTDSAELAQLEADASLDSGAGELDASLDAVDEEFGF